MLGLGLNLSLGSSRVAAGIPSSAYTGLIATRAGFMDTQTTANKQLMSRSPHFSTDTVTALQIAWANFTLTGSSDLESGNAAAATIQAYIEYPAGVLTAVTFSGGATGNLVAVPAAGAHTTGAVGLILSDSIPISIPTGTLFWIRTLYSNTTGIFYLNGVGYRDTANGALLKLQNASTWTTTDLAGTITQSVSNTSYAPCAIIGTTTKASVMMLGDSIMYGLNDTAAVDRRLGIVAHGFPAATLAFLNLSGGGAKSDTAMTRAVGRSLLLPYCSTFYTNLGVNDGALTALQTKANLEAIASTPQAVTGVGLRVATRKYQVTITPRGTSSTDGWTTIANQTTGSNVVYQTISNYGRNGQLAGYTGVCEVTRGVLEDTVDSGKWIVAPTPPYTGDGLHPSAAGYTVAGAALNAATSAYP